MFILKSEIQIGNYIFNSVNEVEITKSVAELADTAVIKMPRKFKVRDNNQMILTEDAIKSGDQVVIKLGYEGKYEGVEFRGYVKKVSPKTPLEIHCEDAIWLLRRKTINKSFGATTLKEVLREVVADTPIKLADKIPDVKFEKYIIKGRNGAQVLQDFKENAGLSTFIDDNNDLYCGFIEGKNIGQTAIYDLNYNIVSNDLEIIDNENKTFLIKYTYIDKKNERLSVEVGDKNGETKDFHTSIVSDPATLRIMANQELKKLKGEGLSGSVTSFLMPFATRGMVAHIIDNEHPKRAGNYFIRSVTTTYGTSGARRKVEISNRL